MPFSITTRDGITINNIPDDIAPDSDVLKQRVAQLRAQKAGEVSTVAGELGELPPEPGADVAGIPFRPFGIETGAELPESLAAGLVGAGRGLTSIARGVGLAEPEAPEVTERFRQLQEARPVATTVGEIAGQAAPFLAPGLGVAGLTGTAARVGATAALGGAEGAIIARGEGGDIGQQLLAGGVGGTVAGALELALPVVGRIGGKIVRRVLGKAPDGAVIDATGRPSAELVEALEKSGQTIDDITEAALVELRGEAVDPEQAARKAFLESQGIVPTRAQVTREAADFQAQQEAAKTSGRVREALEAQEAVLTSRFDNAIVETGGEAVTPTSSVTDALVNKASVLDRQVSDLYKQARAAAPGEKNVRFSALGGRLRRLAPSDRATDGAISSIVGDLQTRGILDDKMKIVGRVDVETAEEVRKLANELFDPQKPFRNAKLRELKDAIDDDVFKAAGQDVFEAGRAAKRDFEGGLARAKISKFDQRKANLVRDVLENKVDPDKLVDQVVFGKKWRAADLKQLKDYIGTDEAGKQAFDDLRAETLHNIKLKSFIGPEDAAGNQALSRDKLQKSITAVGREKINVLFSPDEQKFLKDLLELTKLREPVRGTALGRGPSAQAIARIERKLQETPVLGALVNIVNLDVGGRIAVKGSPQRITPRAILPPEARQLTAQAAGIGAVSATQQEQQ
jgi:hypothetical protein